MISEASVNFDFNGDKVLNQYVFEHSLGKGAFGEVFQAFDKHTKQKYVDYTQDRLSRYKIAGR